MTRHGELMLVLLISSAVGACAGALAAAAGAWLGGVPVTRYMAYGGWVGAFTGALASVASAIFVRVAGRHPLPSLAAVAAVTAAGALLGSWAAGVRGVATCVTVLAVSEAIGLGVALLWVLAYRRINHRLRAAQHDLQQMRSSP